MPRGVLDLIVLALLHVCKFARVSMGALKL